MKRNKWFVPLFLTVLLLSVGCGAKEADAMEHAPADETPLPSAAAEITPEPYISPEPLIHDAWYEERTANLETYVEQYSNLDSAYDRAKRVADMGIDPSLSRIAFTFDDGPKDELTDAILDVCEEYNVRVTFFIKGSYIEGHEAQLKRMLALGCEIGNHTWDHVDIDTLSTDEMRYQIESVNSAIENLLGYRIRLFRPPYISYGKKGSETRNNLISLMKQHEMAVINHTRSTHDTYDDYTEDMIFDRCVAPYDELGHKLHNSIILCHDKTQKTINAFRRAVPVLKEQGFQLVTVSELLYCSDDGFHPGWIYSKAD